MGDSKIEWTEKTWNPVTGCSKVSQGCKNCYALRLFPKVYPGRDFGDVRTHEDRLDAPLHWRKPSRIFVNSMSDLFHEKVPFEFIDKVFAVMALCPQHTFQILTKRPERMLEYLGTKSAFPDELGTVEEDRIEAWGSAAGTLLDGSWEERPWLAGGPLRSRIEHFIAASLGLDENGDMLSEDEIAFPLPNVWLGVSVEDQPTADERIPLLLQTPAAVRWVSYEPALGPVDFMNLGPTTLPNGFQFVDSLRGWMSDRAGKCGPGQQGTRLDWIVCGGESGPGARPMNPDWARSVRDQCQAAGVAFFFKQWGAWDLIPTPFYYNPAIGSGNREYVRALKRFASEHGASRVVGTNPESWRSFELGRGEAIISGRRAMGLVGKKAAGRLLDGRTWDEYPTIRRGA